LKDFEAEYEQCPSVKALKSGDLKQ
jgi:hypothetical protein